MLKRLVTAIGSEIGLQEVALAVGLCLVALGFWDAWRPGAYIVPGAAIVWMSMPVRRPFIHRPLVPRKKARVS